MGFEFALAVVLPSASTGLFDLYSPSQEGLPDEDADDIFFDRKKRRIVPGRTWKVLRYIDFGSVRTLVKPSSRLSIEERAGDDPISRAATCTASFLHDHMYELWRRSQSGSVEHTVPFIADHLLFSRYHQFDLEDFINQYRFEEIFATLGQSDVVEGLWSYNKERYAHTLHSERVAIKNSIFWRYNCALLRPETLQKFFEEHYSPLLWDSAFRVSEILTELLTDGDVSGYELRKEARSAALVRTWRDTLHVLSEEGARCIFLECDFHAEARPSMMTMSQYL